MTSFEIEEIPFEAVSIRDYPDPTGRLNNWPAVYAINDRRDIYVGETGNALLRMTQHLRDPKKQHLEVARILLDDTFHRSACYDLESLLTQRFYSDGAYTVINANDGHRNEEYAGRASFQSRFREIFEDLRTRGHFEHSLRQIENSDFFKLSPFKSLVPDQERAILDILKALFEDIEANRRTTMVVAGEPGTGKTVVGISLIKTLRDKAYTEINERLFGEDSAEITHHRLDPSAECAQHPADGCGTERSPSRPSARGDRRGRWRGESQPPLLPAEDPDACHGLARLAAGYAWAWESDPKKSGMKRIPLAKRPYDIEIDGHQWRWNSTDKDWINSPDALGEVGSIHTVQGYDLNYAGVIIGRDLYFDSKAGEIRFD